MKILHVLDHSIPLHSGYTFRTRAILNQQRAMGWQTCHVTGPKQGHVDQLEETVDGLKFYRTQVPQGLLSKIPALNQLALIGPMRKRILEVIEEEKPDIIHAHSPALNGMAALQAGRKSGKPVVYEIRAFWEDAAVDHGTCKEGDLRYRLTRKLETHVARQAGMVTTICEGLRADLKARGIADSKIVVIPNAVNVEQFPLLSGKDLALQQELGLTNRPVLGFLGSFYAYEGLDLLVRAMPQILQAIPNACLLLVGGGPQEQNLKALVQELKLQDHVIMPGRVLHQEVGRYYSLVDLLVYPRKPMRLTDLVTPLKPLEAMAQGKMVMASDVGGHRELITHGINGWLFKSNDIPALAEQAVKTLKQSHEHGTILQAGREFVENIRNWKNSVSNYKEVYGKLLSGGASRL
ncbi:glycosyltransferase, exosortase A system-associated [Aliiglaciecola sp. CAU 1673]|uniref:TIGR04063 family PEP-CTERM/XrtA system glycosyltransferase n=1 Tax=Aliiglaciecola sp. CAU 1673 TaxID=3032595 RepID=UPI0023D98239|nr:TIGR04063 family PEP-CTERM/XrtA system glycosyltransferase [Aliiglaciecola sp. CAU 1673]MDF2177289.1 glycosyltransferase, exosortase A system-associated [Aliiglaciecola sp. CAU 1673]